MIGGYTCVLQQNQLLSITEQKVPLSMIFLVFCMKPPSEAAALASLPFMPIMLHSAGLNNNVAS